MKLFFKKLTTPKTNETKEVDAVQLWVVRWQSRHGQFCGDVKSEFEAFISEDGAVAFAESIKNAYKLLRHTSGTNVEVTKCPVV